MEKEGFIRGLKIFEDYDLPVKMLVTDRHKALSKWIRENLPAIKHRYDVWHVAKSMTMFKFHPYLCQFLPLFTLQVSEKRWKSWPKKLDVQKLVDGLKAW